MPGLNNFELHVRCDVTNAIVKFIIYVPSDIYFDCCLSLLLV